MIGPREQKMPSRLICTGCEVLVSRELGSSKLIPKKWTVNYCKHPGLDGYVLEPGGVRYIGRGKPWTPKWCPVRP